MTFPNNPRSKKKSQGRNFKYLEPSENETIIYPNDWDAGKAGFRGKFISLMLITKKKI